MWCREILSLLKKYKFVSKSVPLWIALLVELLGHDLPSLIQFHFKYVDVLGVRNTFRRFISGINCSAIGVFLGTSRTIFLNI